MIEIRGITGQSADKKLSRISMLIWGDAGLGKTTLAATMPGKVALLNFDPDGAASIPQATHVDVYDFSGFGAELCSDFITTNPLKIRELCEAYDSIVIDSISAIQDMTLAEGIAKTKGATIIRPSPGAYGARNALLMKLIRTVLAETAKTNTHLLLIAHEGGQKQNSDGIGLPITPAVGGDLPNLLAMRFNEVWHIMDQRGKRIIMVRQGRNKKPMKSRMFNSTIAEFTWEYDPEKATDKDRTINNIYNKWKDNSFNKITPDV